MAVDAFLKLDGIDGESQDHKHKGDIDVLTWSFGATNSGTFGAGGGGGAGVSSMGDFHFTAYSSKATAKLFLKCATGEHIKKAVFIARKAGKEQQEYLHFKFTDLLVSSFQHGGHGGAHAGGDPRPVDQVSFNFDKVEFEYKEQKPDGTLGGAVSSYWQQTTK